MPLTSLNYIGPNWRNYYSLGNGIKVFYSTIDNMPVIQPDINQLYFIPNPGIGDSPDYYFSLVPRKPGLIPNGSPYHWPAK